MDPHGSGVHGSRPAPTCWIRRRRRAGRPREHGYPRPPRRRQPPLPFRRPPHPRSGDTASACRGPGPGRAEAGLKAQRRKEKSTSEWVAAVEDLKTRHAAAAPNRAPRLLSRRAPFCAPPRARPHLPLGRRKPRPTPRLLAPQAPPHAPPPRAASPAPARLPRLKPRPCPPPCPLPQIRACRPATWRPCAALRSLCGSGSSRRRWTLLAPEPAQTSTCVTSASPGRRDRRRAASSSRYAHFWRAGHPVVWRRGGCG